MESIYTELALYGSKNECARTDTVFLHISEVCDGTVSLDAKMQNFFTKAFTGIKNGLSTKRQKKHLDFFFIR